MLDVARQLLEQRIMHYGRGTPPAGRGTRVAKSREEEKATTMGVASQTLGVLRKFNCPGKKNKKEEPGGATWARRRGTPS
ncbi:hypothetical protein AHAS_Ahas01G0176000 [Arachis hypogaea]